MSFTLTDNADGTGLTAAITGTAGGAANVLRAYSFAGDAGGLALAGSFPRSGDGSVSLVLTAGSYFVVLSTDGAVNAAPQFAHATAADASYAEELHDELLAKVQSLPLSGIDAVRIQKGKHPMPQLSPQAGLANGIQIYPVGEQWERNYNTADDVGYGFVVMCWSKCEQQSNTQGLTEHQAWRELIAAAMNLKPGAPPLAHPKLTKIDVSAAGPLIFNPDVLKDLNIDATALLVRVFIRQPR